MWKWNIIKDVSEPEELDTLREVESEDNKMEETESDSDHEAVAAIRGTHTVTFKCYKDIQVARSSEDCELLASGNHVPLDLFPEPQNPYDSRAIAFKAFINNDWHTIGYIVREITDYVHNAITIRKITSMKFAWAKYLLIWYRCGPGYYAGVDITVRGSWPDAVVRVR